jgi:hypothetical protein
MESANEEMKNMNLTEIKGNYDAIFSLGDLCLTSLELQRNQLRTFAGVLDWVSSPSLPDVSRLLKNRFSGFMLKQNLHEAGYSTGLNNPEQYLCLWDTAYNMISSHDFKASENTFAHLASYPSVREKYDRRINRFLEKTATAKRILFVRTEGTFEQAAELENVLSEMVQNDFSVLLINHTNVNGIVEQHWPLKRVCAIELPLHDKWNANHHFWQHILNGIHLTG